MSDYQKIIKGRFSFISAAVVLVSIILLWRLFDVSVVQHGHYLAEAQDQQRYEKIEIAQRGKIYVHDSYNDPSQLYPLAFDVKRFEIWVVPKNVINKNETAKQLSSLVTLPTQEIYDKINNDSLYIPPIKKGLTLDEANKVQDLHLPGVLIRPEYSRYYPESTLASQVLGFVNMEGNGNYGFEGHYNNELKGLSGEIIGEQDTLGRVINLLNQKDPQDGASYILTIDRSVQYFVEKKLKEYIENTKSDSGSVVIMDVKTGGIVAMASSPTYDPNKYSEFADTNANVFINPIIAGLYEPGSIFKPFIMSGALDMGTVTPETEQTFSNMTMVDGYEIHTAENKPFGLEKMGDIIKNSDNVGMVWVSEQLGKDNVYKYVKDFGFLDKTRIDLDTESVGSVPSLKLWHDINRATVSFGQGISVTPIELLAGYATIANKGTYIYPHIVDKMILADGTEKPVEKTEGKRIIKEETANQITTMLVSAVDDGHTKKAGVASFDVAAKTGTAQIPKPGGGYESSEDGLGIYNHSLAGFAPASDPRYAMIVKLEKPKTTKYAESTAAPLFGDISSFLLNYYYRITPTR